MGQHLKAKENGSCRESFVVIVSYKRFSLEASSFGRRPPTMGPQGIPTARPVFGQPSENGSDTNTRNLEHHRRHLALPNRSHSTPTQVRQLIPFQFSCIRIFYECRVAQY